MARATASAADVSFNTQMPMVVGTPTGQTRRTIRTRDILFADKGEEAGMQPFPREPFCLASATAHQSYRQLLWMRMVVVLCRDNSDMGNHEPWLARRARL